VGWDLANGDTSEVVLPTKVSIGIVVVANANANVFEHVPDGRPLGREWPLGSHAPTGTPPQSLQDIQMVSVEHDWR